MGVAAMKEDFNFDEVFGELFKDVDKTEEQQETKEEQELVEENVTAQPISEDEPVKTDLQVAQEKIVKIGEELNSMFVEREEVIDCLLCSLISQQPALLLGNPGTAKSQMVQELCSRIENGRYFNYMLNKTTDPSELFGPFSIKGMENDEFKRITTGRLPEAHVAFIDECYKSNSSCLNMLLTLMNEKIYYNNGKAVKSDLITLIGASNEGPEDSSLDALHDRFIFRINVEYIKDVGNRNKMYNNFINTRKGFSSLASKTTITLDEIKLLNEKSKTAKVDKQVVDTFIRLISSLDREGIHMSDRRQNECFKILQSVAVMNGRDFVTLDDFNYLTNAIWTNESDVEIIRTQINKIVNPYNEKYDKCLIEFKDLKAHIEELSGDERNQEALGNMSKLDKMISTLNNIASKASKEKRDITRYIDLRTEITEFKTEIVKEATGLDDIL